jgi:hypothetical protein
MAALSLELQCKCSRMLLDREKPPLLSQWKPREDLVVVREEIRCPSTARAGGDWQVNQFGETFSVKTSFVKEPCRQERPMSQKSDQRIPMNETGRTGRLEVFKERPSVQKSARTPIFDVWHLMRGFPCFSLEKKIAVSSFGNISLLCVVRSL